MCTGHIIQFPAFLFKNIWDDVEKCFAKFTLKEEEGLIKMKKKKRS
jgi:hypothetical protein